MIKASLSSLSPLHIKLFLQRGAALMLVSERLFSLHKELGAGMLTQGLV